MSRPYHLPLASVVVLAASLAVAGCASTAKTTGHKSVEPVATMQPIPNPPERPATATGGAQPRRRTARPAVRPAPATAPTAPTPTTNPARAARLRASGLEQLNRGSIESALALLRQASQLDPGNALIQRDLERAVRISDAVRAKPR